MEPSDVTVPNSSSIEDERLRRMLLAYVRQEFEAPVGAILGYAEIMLEDAEHQGNHSLIGDLRRLNQAGLELKELVLGVLGPAPKHQEFADFRRNLRHDLRTPISVIKGLAEMLLDDAQELRNEALARDLQKTIEAAINLLAHVDALIDFTGTPLPIVSAKSELTAVSGLIKSVPPLLQAVSGGVGSSRILIVDDTDATRELLSRRLAREGHSIVEVADGHSALEKIAEEKFDLILLDMMMPGINGYEVLTQLKADARFRHIPVIVISAFDDIDSVGRCIEAGAEDYLPKTYDPIILRARIGASLEKTRLREREQAAINELKAEKQRSERLLLNILPQPIIARMHRGETLIADRYHEVTILFSDIVGFTRFSTRRSATDVVKLLNAIFSAVDRLALKYGIEKIKTIGDSYMAVAGLPEARDDHAQAMARLALAMRDVVGDISEQYRENLKVRIGIHTGNAVAGVIGIHKFAYDVWGDTVNTASRMESHGIPNEIQVSHDTFVRLSERFILEPRGAVEIKGKGQVETYLLRSERV